MSGCDADILPLNRRIVCFQTARQHWERQGKLTFSNVIQTCSYTVQCGALGYTVPRLSSVLLYYKKQLGR